ncbi:HutD family protein [Dyella kyungheensis]|jgi:environmental stress-induced protein Ves|uniref:HutD family protein n=1 Tax=Dyella kyungheensis TaxID=1242174 RepID=A0ABS2JNU3_9GAMM|nr:HutD family protein [Dyella kyungheensis]MBM7120689.1 HutD family protein [Dyella kyungheensis]
MSQLSRLPIDSLHGSPWAEGPVYITTVASGPDEENWQWQMTLVDVDQEAVFPSHTDLRRHFVPLDAPVELAFADGHTQHLARLQVAQFDLSHDPQTCLPSAPTRTFNLKLRGDVQGELIVRPLNGAMVLLAPSGWRWFLLLLSGRAKVIADHRSQPLEANDMLWIDPIPSHPVRIEGGGELVLVRLPTA